MTAVIGRVRGPLLLLTTLSEDSLRVRSAIDCGSGSIESCLEYFESGLVGVTTHWPWLLLLLRPRGAGQIGPLVHLELWLV